MRKLTEKERAHITWYLFFGSLALIAWFVGYFFQYGNLIITDISKDPLKYQSKTIKKEVPYKPVYDATQGEK